MKYLAIYIILLIGIITSCTKPPEEIITTIVDTNNAILVLNSGGFNNNNSSITHYDLVAKKASQSYYKFRNGINLGDTGNDMVAYGSKVYVVVNNSSTLEILDKNTGISLKQIKLTNNGISRSPRKIVFDHGKGYLSSFDGTIGLFDTTTLSFKRFIYSGRNPDGICIAHNRLIVTNSGGLDSPNYDSIITVFDKFTLTKDTTFYVSMNPTGAYTAPNGDVYITSNGNYSSVPAMLYILDGITFKIKKQLTININDIEFLDHTAYLSSYNFSSDVSSIRELDINHLSFNRTTNFSNITTLYGIDVDPIEQKIYCLDANSYTKNGKVYCYDTNWKLEYQFETGVIPIKLILLQQK